CFFVLIDELFTDVISYFCPERSAGFLQAEIVIKIFICEVPAFEGEVHPVLQECVADIGIMTELRGNFPGVSVAVYFTQKGMDVSIAVIDGNPILGGKNAMEAVAYICSCEEVGDI